MCLFLKWDFEYQHRWQQPTPGSQLFFTLNGFETGIDYSF